MEHKNFDEKKSIITNALETLGKLGDENPKAAVFCAVEKFDSIALCAVVSQRCLN